MTIAIKTIARSLRMPSDLDEAMGLVARVDGDNITEFLLKAIEDRIAMRRKDPNFAEALRRSIEADQQLLDRLTKDGS